MEEQVIEELHSTFTQEGYIAIDGILSPQLIDFLKISSYYTNLNALEEPSNSIVIGNNITSVQYGSIIGESLLEYLTPYYSSICKKELVPTYSYFRTYTKGNTLVPHTDRPSCQYSATIQINRSKDIAWEFYTYNPKKKVVGHECSLGQIIFYKGEDILHWRNPLEYDSSTHLFLHWVDKNDSNYKKYWYDGRERLGSPK